MSTTNDGERPRTAGAFFAELNDLLGRHRAVVTAQSGRDATEPRDTTTAVVRRKFRTHAYPVPPAQVDFGAYDHAEHTAAPPWPANTA